MENEKTPLVFWTEYVEQSRGTAYFLPDSFKDEAKSLQEQRKEFNDFLNKIVAEKDIDLQVANQIFYHKLRKYLKENGDPDVFSKDIGLNKDAAEQGFFVVNIIPGPAK